MRSSNKSRSRNKNNNRRTNNVGNVVNRVFDSAGPEGKVRGTPQQIIEKYQGLYRDAQLAGDRVAAENFQQHAEHYTRMLSEAQREMNERRDAQQQQQQQQQQNQNANNNGQQQPREAHANNGQPSAPAPAAVHDGNEPQPDIADNGLTTFGEEQPADLVPTPESSTPSKPKTPRQPRKRTPRKPAAPVEAAPEAAKEAAPEPAPEAPTAASE